MIKINVYSSLITSVAIQIITATIEIFSIFIKVSPNFSFLKQMMLLEIFVQLIEGFFYIYWLLNFKNILNITPKRYFDWIITTPTMLINLIFYLIFLQYENNDPNEQLNFFSLFKKEFYTIIIILLLNWTMLLFGFLGEISVIPILLSVFLGFIPFLMFYYIIYYKYAFKSSNGLKIFIYFFIFWSMYGLVAIFPYKLKNICYNFLDLFSKNFFGLFLSYLILSHKNY